MQITKEKKISLGYVFLLVVAICFTYSNTLDNGFVWDDQTLILDNGLVKNIGNFFKFFTTDLHRVGDNQANFYRPLQQVSFCFDSLLWQGEAFGFHLTNMFLHVGVAISVYFLVFCLLRVRLLSFLIALFWSVHPVHSEAVAYISGRADMLFVLFINISFLLYVRFERTKKSWSYFASLASFGLGLLSKEAAFILPFVLLCYVLVFSNFLKKFKEKNKLSAFKEFSGLSGFFIILVVYALLRVTVLDFSAGVDNIFRFGLFTRALTAIKVVLIYLKILVLPVDLHMERLVIPLTSLLKWQVLVFAVLTAGLFYGIKHAKKGKAIFSFSTLFFIVALLPVLNIVYPINALIAEHWLYYPSIGAFLGIGYGFSFFKQKVIRVIGGIFLIALLASYVYLTHVQNRVWRHNIPLYKNILSHNPSSSRVLNNLGTTYARQGKLKEALAYYKEALKLNPDFVDVLNNTGIVYKNLGKYDDALRMYKKVIQLDSDYRTVYHNLGVIYQLRGQYIESVNAFKEGIKRNPYHVETYVNLANVYINMGMYNLAYKECEKALKLNRYSDTARNSLGIILLKQGMYEEASVAFSDALTINPKNASAIENLKIVKNKMLKEMRE